MANASEILHVYEKAPGQLINFSNSVDPAVREEIHQLSVITTIGGMSTYLSIQETLGGAKTKVFAFVKNSLQDRINGWTSKFLTKGGKEVLIKSVAATLPTYIMSSFRLPKTITS